MRLVVLGAGFAGVAAAAHAREEAEREADKEPDREQGMGVHTWRNRDVRAARWLGFLAGVGYSLSDIEQQVIDAAPSEEEDEELTEDALISMFKDTFDAKEVEETR